MEKVYFRDNEKITIIQAIIAMISLIQNVESEIDNENIEKMRKIFLESYTTSENITAPELTLEIAKHYEKTGIIINIEKLKLTCVYDGIIEAQLAKKLSAEQLSIVKNAKEHINNSYIFDILYEYFEINLKRTIISEFFKRMFTINIKSDLKLKISAERIEKIFENETIKNKEEFFCQQLCSWLTYNAIIPFTRYEIKNRKEDASKKDILININFFRNINK